MAGPVDREAPLVGGAAVAEPAQRQLRRRRSGRRRRRRTRPGSGCGLWPIWGQRSRAWLGQPLPQRGLGRGRDLGHGTILTRPARADRRRHGVASQRRRAGAAQQDHDHLFPVCDHLVRPRSAELTRRAARRPGRAPRRAPGPDRAGRRRRRPQRRDRRRPRAARRHRAQVASPVLRRAAGRAGRPAPVRPAAPVHRRPGRRGQGVGLRAAGRPARLPLSRWSLPGPGRRGGPRAAWSPRCRPRRCGAGWPPTRSSPGSTGPGSSPATPTSRSRPAGCWTCTPACWDGEPLGADEYVISADEKSRLQALRPPPSQPPARPGRRPMRVEFEYRRGGTLAYLAAYDVHHAQVIGHCAPTTGIEPFTAPGRAGDDQRALRLRPAGVLDRRQRLLPPRLDRSPRDCSEAWPNAVLVHLPVHASWLNQVEIYFSIVQRKAHHPRRLRRPRRTSPNSSSPSKPATTSRRDPSTGASPATTSTDSSTGSPPNPRRTNGRDH